MSMLISTQSNQLGPDPKTHDSRQIYQGLTVLHQDNTALKLTWGIASYSARV